MADVVAVYTTPLGLELWGSPPPRTSEAQSWVGRRGS